MSFSLFGRLGQQHDQITAHIRDEYSRCTEHGKREFREWVDKLAKSGDAPVHGSGMNIGVHVWIYVQGLQETERVVASPKTLAKALEAWDKGEEYLHRGLEF